MAVPRQIRRQMQKAQKTTEKRPAAPKKRAPGGPPKKRTSPMQFLREVRTELSRVAWPSRQELTSSTAVVLVTLVVVTIIVYAMDLVFSQAIVLLTR